MKIMIVDDNAEMRAFIRSLLEDLATDFVECDDGREAVAIYQSENPDWTIMDIVMRAMDGLTATRLITSKFPGSHITIVTQHNNPKLHQRAQEAGATGFLLKEDLLKLRSVLATEVAATQEQQLHTSPTKNPDAKNSPL